MNQIKMDARLTLRRLKTVFDSYQYRYGNESQLHSALKNVFTEQGIEFTHEKQLNSKNRVDFWVECDGGAIVVEVKIDGSLGDALSQARRYAEMPNVRGVLLASTLRWDSVDPIDVDGTPITVCKLSRKQL